MSSSENEDLRKAREAATACRANTLRERKHGLLWFGVADHERDRWSITDPTSAQLNAAMHNLRYESENQQNDQLRRDILRVLRAAEDYQHLTTYELGVEHIVRKLRAIWRALREGGTDE